MTNIAKLLTEHINVWTAADTEKKSGRGRVSSKAGSVYGVKKLRELILELAVRGKLVPQDANDEPAIELLKHIQSEKEKLITGGKLKKEKPLVPITDDETPFELPKGWEWVRNFELFQLRKGRIPKSLNEDGIGLPYLDIDALDRNVVRRYSEELTCPQSTENDILVVCDGSRSGLVLDGKNGIIGSTLSIIDTPVFIQNYIKLIFKQGFEIFNTSMKGAAIPHLDTQKLRQNITALPPLAEQHRIVGKVDELMGLCDQLEQQHSNTQEAHETLVGHMLATLTQSQNATEFNTNWQRTYAHFDLLFTTEASIDALKQTVLQFAYSGRFSDKNVNGWQKVKLNAITLLIADIDHKMPKAVKDGVIFLSAKDLKDDGTLDFSDPKFISREDFLRLSRRILPRRGDIIYSRIGARLGKARLVEVDTEFLVSYSCCVIRPDEKLVNTEYLVKFLDSRLALDQAHLGKQSIGVPDLGLGVIKEYVIPLPPLAEQHHIVAKVDAIIALCDQLKTRIQQASQQQKDIADNLVSHSSLQ